MTSEAPSLSASSSLPALPRNLLSIQSWVSYGHVGNAAAMFPLQRLGFEVWARVVYVPLYAFGVPYVRSLVWTVSFAGLVMILAALFV